VSKAIVLSGEERGIVQEILSQHLPLGTQVFVFGSRAGGRAKPLSDLDLSLEAPHPLPLAALASLAEAFDESPLPWKVDLVERASVSQAFGKIIDAAKLPFAFEPGPAPKTALAKS
jgi:uncharacterized protein